MAMLKSLRKCQRYKRSCFGRWQTGFCSSIYSVIPINESHLWFVMFSNSLQSFVTLGVWYCHQTLMEISPEQFNTIHWVVQGLLTVTRETPQRSINFYLLTLNLISITVIMFTQTLSNNWYFLPLVNMTQKPRALMFFAKFVAKLRLTFPQYFYLLGVKTPLRFSFAGIFLFISPHPASICLFKGNTVPSLHYFFISFLLVVCLVNGSLESQWSGD